MTIPFTVLSNGAVSTESDENIQLSQRVAALVGTEVGQRTMRATLGLPLSQLLFGISDSLVTAELRDKVISLLNTYEPGLNVLSVKPTVNNANDGKAGIEVEYTPVLQASLTRLVSDVAVIKVGGTVEDVTLNGNG